MGNLTLRNLNLLLFINLNIILICLKKMSAKIQKLAATPLATLFEMHKKELKVRIWLSEHSDLKIEGKIAGFDEYMNLVLRDAYEISEKKNTLKTLGTILLKGENLSMITQEKKKEKF